MVNNKRSGLSIIITLILLATAMVVLAIPFPTGVAGRVLTDVPNGSYVIVLGYQQGTTNLVDSFNYTLVGVEQRFIGVLESDHTVPLDIVLRLVIVNETGATIEEDIVLDDRFYEINLSQHAPPSPPPSTGGGGGGTRRRNWTKPLPIPPKVPVSPPVPFDILPPLKKVDTGELRDFINGLEEGRFDSSAMEGISVIKEEVAKEIARREEAEPEWRFPGSLYDYATLYLLCSLLMSVMILIAIVMLLAARKRKEEEDTSKVFDLRPINKRIKTLKGAITTYRVKKK